MPYCIYAPSLSPTYFMAENISYILSYQSANWFVWNSDNFSYNFLKHIALNLHQTKHTWKYNFHQTLFLKIILKCWHVNALWTLLFVILNSANKDYTLRLYTPCSGGILFTPYLRFSWSTFFLYKWFVDNTILKQSKNRKKTGM